MDKQNESKKDMVSDALTPTARELQNDRIYAWLKSGTGVIPGIGAAICTYLGELQPDWKFKRVRNVLIWLERRVTAIENGETRFHLNVSTEAGADLLQEGLEQSEKAITEYRQEVLGRVLANSLTSIELNHEQDFLVLSTLKSLSEYELIHFIDYATQKGSEFKFNNENFRNLHLEILQPRATHLQSTMDEIEAASTQRQYKAMLAQKGLLMQTTTQTQTPSYKISSFGKLFFRRLDIEEQ